jgi:phage tail-like protein
MAETGSRNDPVLGFRFIITFNNQSLGGFSECSGLQLETEIQDYAEGGLNTHMHKFPGRTKQSNITLKRGIVDRGLWDWYYNLTRGIIRLRTGSIVVLDPGSVIQERSNASDAVMQWDFERAFPAKWVGPDLNASQSNVAVETLELCHQGLKRIK